MPQVFFIGDSITWGAWDKDEGGWAERLRREIDRYQIGRDDFWCPTYNLGIPGDTSEKVVSRMKREIEARWDPGERAVVVVAIGINDSLVRTDVQPISASQFAENYRTILEISRSFTDQVMCVGLFPIDERVLTPVSWDARVSYTRARAAEFNRVCAETCRVEKIPFVDLWSAIGSENLDPLLTDGLHPSSAGHNFVYRSVRAKLIATRYLLAPFELGTP